MSSLHFSFLQLKAMDSFIGIQLSLTNIFVPSLKLCFWLFNFADFFLFSKILLQFFLLAKRTIVFLDLDVTSGLPNLWQASMSFSSILTFISDIMEITVFSKLLSSMESGISLITMLFLLPYWAREFCSVSSLTIPVCYIFVANSYFLPVDIWLLSFKLFISSFALRPE